MLLAASIPWHLCTLVELFVSSPNNIDIDKAAQPKQASKESSITPKQNRVKKNRHCPPAGLNENQIVEFLNEASLRDRTNCSAGNSEATSLIVFPARRNRKKSMSP